MTASNTPKPGDEPTPDERADATTEILAGFADPDRAPTEVLGAEAADADRTPTEVIADADADRTTKVLPESSAHSTLVPPKPKASDPTTRVLPEPAVAAPLGAAGASARPAPSLQPPAAPDPGSTPLAAGSAHRTPTAASAAPAPGGTAPTAGPATPVTGGTPGGPGASAPGGGAYTTHGAADAVPASFPRPQVRWAGIIWGLVFAVSAALLLWVFSEPERRDAVGDWWATLTPIGFALTALLIAGGLLLIGGIAGLARRLSHRPA